GYLIGLQLMEVAGFRIIDFYGLSEEYTSIGDLYNRYNAWAVMIAGFTPIPYKIFTIAGGAFQIDFSVFMAASAISRTARFFLVAWFIYLFGAGIRLFIDKYFNLLTVLFTVLLAGGFILIKYIV
ncbi:MAG: hypothetical protein RBS82_11620, partial [Syntrophales bacterium]|nr:hypothetical protein [Syntrophales bacterium]